MTLGDTGRWVSGGTPATSDESYWGGEIPWMSSKSLTNFRIRDSDRRLSELGAKSGTKVVPKDTILMVVRGMSLKSEFRMGITQREVALSQDLKGLIPRADIDPTFLAYALQSRSDDVLDMVDEAGHGTGRLQTDRLFALEVSLPPRAEQEAIAATLGAVDDKIESNRRAADTLVALIRTLFEQVLSSHEVVYAPLGELARAVNGRSYKSSELRESSTALVTLKSVDRNGGYKENGLKPYTGPHKPEQEVRPGEIVVAQTDLTQGAEVVGRGVRVPRSVRYDTLVASLDLAIVRPLAGMPVEYLHGLLSSEAFRQHCRAHVTGTTVLHLAKDAMPTWSAPTVPLDEQERFAESVRPMLARMDALSEESARLVALRDALLPEILSGRVRVPAEGAVP
ncbi:restriction endonuclease subunit S [Microbacterium sp. NPDC089180]|uniref:restriction endonuclease subunit S n=1 Tax=unclassified Microbacterium TaxID=2609290 RepID=UPI00341A99A7